MSDRPALREGVAQGFPWKVVVAPHLASLNGYVRLSTGHLWFGLFYDDIPAEVHGGLTYGCDEDGWIGFDTGHFNDYWSAEEIHRFDGDPTYAWWLNATERRLADDDPYTNLWTIEKMIAETENLARQAAKALDTPTAGV